MRFLKQKTLSKYSPSDQTLFANHYGRAVMEITGGLRLPKGTTAQRPQLSGVRTTGGANGFMRYNTTTNSIEAYIDGVWEVVRAPGATAITKQTLGPGNEVETTFGPLTKIPNSENNILVFVENVFQIPVTNYSLVQNPPAKAAGWYIEFGTAVPFGKDVTVLHNFDK